MIEYRRFRNTDPPHVLRLWQTAGLGRGAALGLSADQFDDLTFAQPYFDRNGLIVACDNATVVGYVHAGFKADAPSARFAGLKAPSVAVIVAPNIGGKGSAASWSNSRNNI